MPDPFLSGELFPREEVAGETLLTLDLAAMPAGLAIGTSSFSNDDWRGAFYPSRLRPGEYLKWYATQLSTVEVDATFYAIPPPATVAGWASKVGPGFRFSLKAPGEITHHRGLVNARAPWNQFWRAVQPLGEKRGPILFQFPYISRTRDPEEHRTGANFIRRLSDFLPLLSEEGQYVVEVRNASWIDEPLDSLLREHGVALAWIDYYTMPPVAELMQRADLVTGGFGYVRFLGNHREMDALVAGAVREGRRQGEWGSLLVDRTLETRAWIPAIRQLADRVPLVFVYYNNHYAGFAPGSIDLLKRLWREDGTS